MPAAKKKRVQVHLGSPGAKLFTTAGTYGTGSIISLPEGEARRFLDLGVVRLTEAETDGTGEDVNVVEDRPVTP